MLELPPKAQRSDRLPGRLPIIANSSCWVRAPEGGVWRTTRRIGDAVAAQEVIGYVANPFEEFDVEVRSPHRGIIIGATTLPVVNMGDAVFHLAWAEEMGSKPRDREAAEPLMDEDEII